MSGEMCQARPVPVGYSTNVVAAYVAPPGCADGPLTLFHRRCACGHERDVWLCANHRENVVCAECLNPHQCPTTLTAAAPT